MPQLDAIKSKILSGSELERILAYWKFRDQKIVFSNGCFDLLHLGHIDYLSKAADLGNILIIGLNTDASVSRIKGPHRPLQEEQSRAMVLASLKFVDAVVLFGEDTPYELIQKIQPDVLVKGSDYNPEDIVGYDIVIARGGKVVTIDFLHGYSTSGIEKRILANAHLKK